MRAHPRRSTGLHLPPAGLQPTVRYPSSTCCTPARLPSQYIFSLNLAVGEPADHGGVAAPFIGVVPRRERGITTREWAGSWSRYIVKASPVGRRAPVDDQVAEGRVLAGLSAGASARSTSPAASEVFGRLASWSGYFHPIAGRAVRLASRATVQANDPASSSSTRPPGCGARESILRLDRSAAQPMDPPLESFAFAAELRRLRCRGVRPFPYRKGIGATSSRPACAGRSARRNYGCGKPRPGRTSGDVNIAYQVVATAVRPRVRPRYSRTWSFTGRSRASRRFSSSSLVLAADPLTSAAPECPTLSGAPTLETRMDDVRAVWTRRSRRAASSDCPRRGDVHPVARTYPERTAALAFACLSRMMWAPTIRGAVAKSIPARTRARLAPLRPAQQALERSGARDIRRRGAKAFANMSGSARAPARSRRSTDEQGDRHSTRVPAVRVPTVGHARL